MSPLASIDREIYEPRESTMRALRSASPARAAISVTLHNARSLLPARFWPRGGAGKAAFRLFSANAILLRFLLLGGALCKYDTIGDDM